MLAVHSVCDLSRAGGGAGCGVVALYYRAYQPAVGREVAVTVIAPERADDPALIRRFAALARYAEGERRFDHARTRLLYGELLRRARRRTDARSHLRSAMDAFERLGATPWQERARSELRASGETARKREPSTLTELTPQQTQIARLVAEGASNKDVAAQLFLSPRTVDYHLRNVFVKARQAGTTFHLVDDDIEAVPDRAIDAADGRDVRLGAGVSTAQQYPPGWPDRVLLGPSASQPLTPGAQQWPQQRSCTPPRTSSTGSWRTSEMGPTAVAWAKPHPSRTGRMPSVGPPPLRTGALRSAMRHQRAQDRSICARSVSPPHGAEASFHDALGGVGPTSCVPVLGATYRHMKDGRWPAVGVRCSRCIAACGASTY